MRELRKGDKVKFLNEVGEAEVIEVLPSGLVLLEDENGFDMEIHAKELLLVNTDEQGLYNNKLPEISEILDRDLDEKNRKAIEQNFKEKYSNIQKVNSKGEESIGLSTCTSMNLLIMSMTSPIRQSSIFN